MMMRILDTVKLKLRKFFVEKTYFLRNKKLKNNDFTIISNNCWAGTIYQSYGLKYKTPTLGLFFMAKDYINFISNLKYYVSKELIFINPKDSKWYNKLKNEYKFGKYPIGKIDDIEIFFLHYKTTEDALKKWEERKKRINYKNIVYKFSEMNDCEYEDIVNFQNLKLKNKICFISKKNKSLQNVYTFVVSKSKKNIKSFEEPFGNSRKVNITNFLNKLK